MDLIETLGARVGQWRRGLRILLSAVISLVVSAALGLPILQWQAKGIDVLAGEEPSRWSYYLLLGVAFVIYMLCWANIVGIERQAVIQGRKAGGLVLLGLIGLIALLVELIFWGNAL